jgi:hypothetical protein
LLNVIKKQKKKKKDKKDETSVEKVSYSYSDNRAVI